MRFLLINHMQNAYQSLHSSRVRSALTMLGVTIGVASVTAILALSGGASQLVSNQIDSLGGNIAIVKPGASIDILTSITQPQTTREYAISTVTEQDLASINKTKHVQSSAPLMLLNGVIKGDSTAPSGTQIVATTPELADISQLEIKEGQFIDNKVTRDTVVIGTQLSIDVFGTDSSLGRVLKIRDKPYTVIGVLKRVNDPINYNSIDFDNAAIVNFETGKKLNQDTAQIQQINIKVDTVENLDGVVQSAKESILKNHHGEENFSVLTGEQISQPSSQLFYVISGVSTAVATISLVVGGIGIMNIMLVTVAERTREIGIRKALGASNADIMWQFLIESLSISISGGIIGYIFGYILAYVVSGFLTFSPAFSLDIAGVAICISIIMGTLFGLYPALRAAGKDPINSLYQYN
jgi:putative ABC transport system permease protein